MRNGEERYDIEILVLLGGPRAAGLAGPRLGKFSVSALLRLPFVGHG